MKFPIYSLRHPIDSPSTNAGNECGSKSALRRPMLLVRRQLSLCAEVRAALKLHF